MSPRGGWRGGGRPAKPDDDKRVQFGCKVDPKTSQWFDSEKDRTGLSKGQIVDKLVEEAKKK